MKTQTKRQRIVLRAGRDHSLRRFHPWVFSGAVEKGAKAEPGALVDVFAADGEYLATGHYAQGSIAVRVISFSPVEDVEAFLQERLSRAFALRRGLGLVDSDRTNAYRLINAEGDGLPGLVVDIYRSVAVVQCHSEGMAQWKGQIVVVLQRLYPALSAVVDRSPESSARTETEGDERLLFGTSGKVEILEDGLSFEVDCCRGQKTGFFLDQRENRRLLERYASGRTVLNAFCYTGGFSLYALRGNARHVDSVDVSGPSIEKLRENVARNFTNPAHEAKVGDCMELLAKLDSSYDLLVLDPPAFIKHQGALKGGIKGYDSINYHAFRALPPGGVLFTFSCSQFMPRELFLQTVAKAAARARRQVRVLHQLGAAPCHPVSLAHPEGEYLKGLVLEVG